MSYLSYPQINFQGTAYCNPSTGDNNDFAYVFDIDTLTFAPTMTVIDPAQVIDPPGEQTFNYQGPQSAPGCRDWLMGLMKNVKDGGPYGQQAHWNYYGDHGTRLDNTQVTTLFGSDGKPFPKSDPLYQATIKLIGTPSPMQFQDPVIVDNDPYALITSQIFSHGFTVTGSNGTSLISAVPTPRSYAYYINVYKNLDPQAIGFQMVSAIFITSVPSGPDLIINTSAGSPALNDLAAAVAKGAGLQLRFIFYNAIYQIAPCDLHDMFKKGDYAANPYIGKTLGTIGVLSQGDMLSAPPGRKLNLQSRYFFFNPKTNPCVPTGNSQDSGACLGITLANIDPVTETVYLDCVSTFPECNVKTNAKFNFGPKPMNLVLTPDGGQPITLGPIPNTQQGYETMSGMVAIPLSNHPQLAEIKASATSGTLSIFDGNSQQTMLMESPGVDILTENRAVYFDVQVLDNWGDETEQPRPGTATVTIKAFKRGVPVQQATPINIEYWMCAKDQINPSKPQVPVPLPPSPSKYFTVAGAVPQPPTQYTNAPGNPGTIQVITDRVIIPANSNGELTLTLIGVRPGTSLMRFRDPSRPPHPPIPAMPPPPPNFVWDNVNYCCIRILPFDDYRSYTRQQIDNWPFMYEHFFNYFALLYPVMSQVIPWGPLDAPDNPEIVAQFASQLRLMTNPDIWNTTIYMPITRDLSAGKRALLWRWCALQVS